jgi:hypothetical protein
MASTIAAGRPDAKSGPLAFHQHRLPPSTYLAAVLAMTDPFVVATALVTDRVGWCQADASDDRACN